MEEEPEHLRLLIERLDPDNYTFEQRGNEIVPVDFNWPEAIARKNEEDIRKLAERQTISQLPSALPKVSRRRHASSGGPATVALELPPSH